MNEEIISITDLDLPENPIICLILAVVIVVGFIIFTPVDMILQLLIMNENMLIVFLIMLILSPISSIFAVAVLLFFGDVLEVSWGFNCLSGLEWPPW